MLNEICDIAVKNASELSDNDQEQFRKIRMNGLGASDSSVVLGVNPFPDNTEAELIRQKISKEPTEVSKKISALASVRKGSDLEHIILDKFCDEFKVNVFKPNHMYKLIKHPHITINYDGLMIYPDEPEIPVEVKLITRYGMKYYTKDKCIVRLDQEPVRPESSEAITSKYIKDMADKTGIPVYYYTQIQQQMLGTGSEYAYLVGMDDDNWRLVVWKIYRDPRTIENLLIRSAKLWGRIEKLKDRN